MKFSITRLIRLSLTLATCLGLLIPAAQAQQRADAGPLGSQDAPAAVAAPSGVVSEVGPGDTIRVTVFGQPDLSAEVTLDAEGNITLPLIGALHIANMTPAAISRDVEKRLQQGGFVLRPQVIVTVLAIRSRVVSLLGEVVRPGRYPIEQGLTLLELMAQAGGTREGAADHALLLRQRPDQSSAERLQRKIGNLQSPAQLDTVQNEVLHAGDIIIVPPAPRFFIYGQVTNSGAYPMEENLDVMRALSLAGGLTPRASESRIDIVRAIPDTEEKETFRANLDSPVRPGDVIHVHERFF
ncbi:polysaccharide biosynthesis/export family protein [Kerstersia sp.]|uniref:polysaccharide biosynthesis/export family protein n=1 Tax=Kerstersia sp. TaxID=1930783 RepID=UPI003F907040